MPARARTLLGLGTALVATLALAACGSSKKTAATPKPSAAACTPAGLHTRAKDVLTVATDSPAYPPYFEDNKPTNGKGFESAVAFAVARKLGYGPSQTKWVVEPFDSSYAPGSKAFDFDINEISITPARAKEVDFSTPYYTNPQGILVAANGPYAHATSLSAFHDAKIGVQIGTTSLAATSAQIKPAHQPQVFNTSNDVVSDFKIGRVNAIVVDLATAFELTSEIPHSTIAGQFNASGGDRWGLLLAKGSPLTGCVDRAVSALQANGTLDRLSRRWIASAAQVPDLR